MGMLADDQEAVWEFHRPVLNFGTSHGSRRAPNGLRVVHLSPKQIPRNSKTILRKGI